MTKDEDTNLEQSRLWQDFLSTNPSLEERYNKARTLSEEEDVEQEFPIPSLGVIYSTISTIGIEAVYEIDPLQVYIDLLQTSDISKLRILFKYKFALDNIYSLTHILYCRSCLARCNFKDIWQIIKNYKENDFNIDWESLPELKSTSQQDYSQGFLRVLTCINNRTVYGGDWVDSLAEDFRTNDSYPKSAIPTSLINFLKEEEDLINLIEEEKNAKKNP